MSSISYKLGKNAKAYVGTAGTDATTEVKGIKDTLQVSLTYDKIDATTRLSAASGFKVYEAGLCDLEVSFDMACDAGDEARAAIRTAFKSGGKVSFKVLDSANGDGVKFDAVITDFSEDQPLSDLIKNSVKLSPAVSSDTYLPAWIDVTSGGGSSGGIA